jgi:predicted enzyme related to lactoylglutathione lyase
MNTIGYFEIQSSDLKRELNFYRNIFGWKFIREEFLPIEYYRIQTDSFYGGLLQRPANVPPPEFGTNAFVCSVLVDHFDQTCELILQNGGQIALPKFGIPGRGWHGYFIDQDNNTFGIFESDKNAR